MTLVLRRPATAPPLRAVWVLILAAVLALALAGGALVAGTRMLLNGPPNNGRLAGLVMPPTACPPGTVLKSGDIATIAGTGVAGNSGDDGPATSADLQTFDGGSMAADADGAIYFSQDGVAIRRIGIDGVITTLTLAGANHINAPSGVAFDAAGDLYVADLGWLWKRDLAGNVTRVAGQGVDNASGDGGPALGAEINAYGLIVAPNGDLIIDDYMDAGVRRSIDPAGTIRRFAGSGSAGSPLGDGGPATAAGFGFTAYASAAGPDGSVYVGDREHFRIRKVDPSGIITTYVGTGQYGNSGDGGPATEATIAAPVSMVVDDSGNLYFADKLANVIRKVSTAGLITTIAGTAKNGFSGDCGPATAAQLNEPNLLAIHDGILYVGDFGNHRIRMIVP